MTHLRLFCKFILHFFTARNTGGYAIHSPFLFQLNQFVIQEKHPFYVFDKIEKLRKELKCNSTLIPITDFGTGVDRNRTIASITKSSLKSAKYGQLMFRIAHYIHAKNILELGTSLGLTTAYLAAAAPDINCVTLEGCPNTASFAQRNFNSLSLNKIQLRIGDINSTLQPVLDEFRSFDLIFIDANHRCESLLKYFNQSLSSVHHQTVLLVDDIYWSAEMELAWNTIKAHSKVTATMDLFQLGIVFFNPELHKKHYKIRF